MGNSVEFECIQQMWRVLSCRSFELQCVAVHCRARPVALEFENEASRANSASYHFSVLYGNLNKVRRKLRFPHNGNRPLEATTPFLVTGVRKHFPVRIS